MSTLAPNVFLAWSREGSKAVALALHKWLPIVLQRANPWISDNIDKGKRWREEVTKHLGTIRVGILCVTSENITAPWLNFEAGALSRLVENDSRVIPFLLDLNPTDYADPLAMFQAARADQRGTKDLLRSINAAMDTPVSDATLETTFTALWPKLAAELDDAQRLRNVTPSARPRSERSMLKEILIRLRSLERPMRVRRLAVTKNGSDFILPSEDEFADFVSDKSLDDVIVEYIIEEDDQKEAGKGTGEK